MNTTIEAAIVFSFKGENYDLCETLDLDAIMALSGSMPDIHFLLARHNNIDTYSYLYEAMESYPVIFRKPTGLAVAFLEGDNFNIVDFEQAWNEQKISQLLDAIANKHLPEAPTELRGNIKLALLEAYNAAKTSSKN
jgi:hypothetical protein